MSITLNHTIINHTIINHIIGDDETFFYFLKYQGKGVFDNDFYCTHKSLLRNICISCIKEFIRESEYTVYFEQLYS